MDRPRNSAFRPRDPPPPPAFVTDADAETSLPPAAAPDADPAARPPHLLSIALEDYFDARPFHQLISERHRRRLESRIDAQTDRVLRLLDRVDAGDLLLARPPRRDPRPAPSAGSSRRGTRSVPATGSPPRCCGSSRAPTRSPSGSAWRTPAVGAGSPFSEASGTPVRGFRVARGRFGARGLGMLEAVAAAGFAYDSSFYPTPREGRTRPMARFPFVYESGTGPLVEMPVSTWGPRRLAVGRREPLPPDARSAGGVDAPRLRGPLHLAAEPLLPRVGVRPAAAAAGRGQPADAAAAALPPQPVGGRADARAAGGAAPLRGDPRLPPKRGAPSGSGRRTRRRRRPTPTGRTTRRAGGDSRGRRAILLRPRPRRPPPPVPQRRQRSRSSSPATPRRPCSVTPPRPSPS